MDRPVTVLSATDELRTKLRPRANGRANEHRERCRGGIVLQRLVGVGINELAARPNTSARVVATWSTRFERSGLAGFDGTNLRDSKPILPEYKVARVITEATRPARGPSR